MWAPSPERAAQTAMARFMREAGMGDYAALHRWSVEHSQEFWNLVWDEFGVIGEKGGTTLVDGERMPGARWFPDGRLNFAENLLRRRGRGEAIVFWGEDRIKRRITHDQLHDLDSRLAQALADAGVKKGDRVAGYLPNLPQSTAAMLATASLGAVWSSCSPDFGVRSVVDRFAQIEPRVLLAVDGYRYGGRDHERLGVVRELQQALPSLERTVVLGYLDPEPSLGRLRATTSWDAFVAEGGEDPLSFAQVPFDHPLWVLYSSGTTGLPKAIVHGHGGILLELLKMLHLHVDMHADDRLFWFTTTGWMMWNFLSGGLLTEGSIVLYDGNPGHPDLGTLWALAEQSGVTCFGTSASFIASCMKARISPRDGRDLSRLEAVGSTGSPLSPDGFDWIYDRLGPNLWLFSTSGGTDLCTAFVGGVPTLPVYRGELQARALGAKVEAWSAEGRPVVGEVGELVITEPMPSMPIELWGDSDDTRYRASYFETFPGVWRHGDWIEITDRGTANITCRSDATINRGGIRMGTAEIYRAVLAIDDVVDALVVDLAREGTQGYMPLFVVLRPGVEMDGDLVARIEARIREDCSPRHVPDEIRAVPSVPRTLSGKVLEVPVKRILSGEPAEKALSRDSLADPDALRPFEQLAAEWRG
jgi:acetoacetyl-CoA synthetase